MSNRIIIFILLIFIILSKGLIQASDFNLYKPPEEKYNLSICAIIKNEASYLKEWIEYHRLFGVDHFYLYNIGSHNFFNSALQPYVDEGILTLINWPEIFAYENEDTASKWALCTQIPAYENAVNFRARMETKWMIFLEIDEFLVCPEPNNIADLLQKYEDLPGISLTSVFYDAGMYHDLSQKYLLIQTVDLTNPPQANVYKAVSKMIFKPDQCIGFLWPPYQLRFKESQKSTAADRREMRINQYIINEVGYFPFNKPKLDIDNRFLSEEMISLLLEAGYVIEDRERPIYKLIPDLIKKLKGVKKKN